MTTDRSGPVHEFARTDLHNLILGEERIGSPLNRTMIRHGTNTSLTTIRSTITDRSGTDGPFQNSSVRQLA
jgi:hypothetical protein